MRTYIKVNDQRAHMPPQGGRGEAKLGSLPLLLPVEPDLRRSADIRRRMHKAPSLVEGMVLQFLGGEPAGLADRNIDRIPEAKCTSGECAPGQELAVGGERAVVVVADHDGDDVAILQLREDRRSEVVIEIVLVGVGICGPLRGYLVAGQDHGGRVGEERLERGRDLRRSQFPGKLAWMCVTHVRYLHGLRSKERCWILRTRSVSRLLLDLRYVAE